MQDPSAGFSLASCSEGARRIGERRYGAALAQRASMLQAVAVVVVCKKRSGVGLAPEYRHALVSKKRHSFLMASIAKKQRLIRQMPSKDRTPLRSGPCCCGGVVSEHSSKESQEPCRVHSAGRPRNRHLHPPAIAFPRDVYHLLLPPSLPCPVCSFDMHPS